MGKAYGFQDMCELPELSKEAILANLKSRFESELVYSYVGDIIVSVNPFKNVGCVGKAIRSKYRGAARHELPPHIYSLVDICFSRLMADQQSQSILISGESGAGKTEAMKICLTYISQVRLRHGPRMGRAWAAHGPRMGRAWAAHGPRMRTSEAQWQPCG